MDFSITEEQKMIVDTVRKFAEKEIAPRAAYYDETGEFPWENIEKLKNLKLMGVTLPEQYGGMGESTLTLALILKELFRFCSGTAGVLFVHTVGCGPIDLAGNEAQKKKYLPILASGEKLGAFALTEPNAGSDAAAISTRAVLTGDQYVLNGTKCFTSNGGEAGIYVIMAKTDAGKGVKGISAFVVEKGTPGFSFGSKDNKMGNRGAVSRELILEDCRIPKENLLEKEGAGFKIAMKLIDKERATIGFMITGVAEAALDYAIKYAKQRICFGKPVASFQGIQWMMAEMATKIKAAEALGLRAIDCIDRGIPCTEESAMAKYFTAETVMEVTTNAVQILGGYGYMKEYPVERWMRDAKFYAIGGGTTQIQKNVIAETLLKRMA